MGAAPIHRRRVLQIPLQLQQKLHLQLNLGDFFLRRTRLRQIPLGAQTLRTQQTKPAIQRMPLFRTLLLG